MSQACPHPWPRLPILSLRTKKCCVLAVLLTPNPTVELRQNRQDYMENSFCSWTKLKQTKDLLLSFSWILDLSIFKGHIHIYPAWSNSIPVAPLLKKFPNSILKLSTLISLPPCLPLPAGIYMWGAGAVVGRWEKKRGFELLLEASITNPGQDQGQDINDLMPATLLRSLIHSSSHSFDKHFLGTRAAVRHCIRSLSRWQY